MSDWTGRAFRGSRLRPRCGSLLCMAQSGRFGLSLRILTVLASAPEAMHTSAVIAEELQASAVMVRRCFLLLHKGGLIEQRKGPHGGARLKLAPKQIGVGDIYVATEGDWLVLDDPAIAGLLKRVRAEGILAMNETTLAQMVKKLKKKPLDSAQPEEAPKFPPR
jgi:DNA-binding IscR family transcriptional regulator